MISPINPRRKPSVIGGLGQRSGLYGYPRDPSSLDAGGDPLCSDDDVEEASDGVEVTSVGVKVVSVGVEVTFVGVKVVSVGVEVVSVGVEVVSSTVVVNILSRVVHSCWLLSPPGFGKIMSAPPKV